MFETTQLALTFGEARSTSNADPLLEKRRYETRALSSVYMPEKARAQMADDKLLIEYVYDTDERPAFTYQSGPGFSIQIGRETKRVLSLAVTATQPETFSAHIDACAKFLKDLFGTASQQRHYIIVADSLAGFKTLVLREYYRK